MLQEFLLKRMKNRFSSQFKKYQMIYMRIKLLSYTIDLVLSNKHLKVFVQCLEPKIFNLKVEVLFDFFLLCRVKSQLSH